MFPCAQQCVPLGAGAELHHVSRHLKPGSGTHYREILLLRKTWPTLDIPLQIFSMSMGFSRSVEGKLCPQSSGDLLQGSSSDWCSICRWYKQQKHHYLICRSQLPEATLGCLDTSYSDKTSSCRRGPNTFVRSVIGQGTLLTAILYCSLQISNSKQQQKNRRLDVLVALYIVSLLHSQYMMQETCADTWEGRGCR